MSGVQLYDRTLLVPQICERLAKGEPLAVICRDIGIARRTVYQWRDEDASIAEQLQDARDDGEDVLAFECLKISDTPVRGEEVKYDADGKMIERKVVDMLGHRKFQVETRLKLLAKWSKRYADKPEQSAPGAAGGGITVVVKGGIPDA